MCIEHNNRSIETVQGALLTTTMIIQGSGTLFILFPQPSYSSDNKRHKGASVSRACGPLRMTPAGVCLNPK